LSNNSFFKPTPLYKEFMILDLIEKDSKITQRVMSDYLSVSVSMINAYLDSYEEKGYLKRIYLSIKTVEYHITRKGIERKKVLNIWYLESSHAIYTQAKDNIVKFLDQIIIKGYKKILFYGAGEVAEIMLQVINDNKQIPLEVIGVIDDDINKRSQLIVNKPIISLDDISHYEHDAILISSYSHNSKIYGKLVSRQYNIKKIIQFFKI